MADFNDALIALGQGFSGANARNSTPSAIQEYMYYNNLPPEEQQRYLTVKRAQQVLNLGGTQGVLNPSGAGLSQEFAVTPKPEQLPEFQGQQERAKVTAKAAGEKEVMAPAVTAAIDNSVKVIDDALTHPGFDANFGVVGQAPNIPGGSAADASTYLNQIKGKAFLTAIGEMKGSGSISEREGEAATAAVGRLGTAQSPESARKALEELKGIMEGARQRAQPSNAGSPSQPADAPEETKVLNNQTYVKIKGQWYTQ